MTLSSFCLLTSVTAHTVFSVTIGALQGIPRARVNREADELLDKVKLRESGAIITNAYSGGMRRRLSVAIALLGGCSLGDSFVRPALGLLAAAIL